MYLNLTFRSVPKSAIKQRLCHQFIQKWFSHLDNSARGFYKVVNKKNEFEEYLIKLSKLDKVYITKLRTSNLKLPIEIGRWNNLAHFVNTKIGDEFHTNDRIVQLRQNHITIYYRFIQIMQQSTYD